MSPDQTDRHTSPKGTGMTQTAQRPRFRLGVELISAELQVTLCGDPDEIARALGRHPAVRPEFELAGA